jgi:hypothetical protein
MILQLLKSKAVVEKEHKVWRIIWIKFLCFLWLMLVRVYSKEN